MTQALGLVGKNLLKLIGRSHGGAVPVGVFCGPFPGDGGAHVLSLLAC